MHVYMLYWSKNKPKYSLKINRLIRSSIGLKVNKENCPTWCYDIEGTPCQNIVKRQKDIFTFPLHLPTHLI